MVMLTNEGAAVGVQRRSPAVQLSTVVWNGEGSLAVALSLNLKRRHLNESQRALVAARLAKMMEAEAKKRRGVRRELAANVQPTSRRRSADEAGVTVNVSARLINYAIKVLREGCAELVVAVESGQLPVSTAARLAALPKAQQTRAAAGGPAELLRKARQIRAGVNKAAGARSVIGPPSGSWSRRTGVNRSRNEPTTNRRRSSP